jgi:hypothetical protein
MGRAFAMGCNPTMDWRKRSPKTDPAERCICSHGQNFFLHWSCQRRARGTGIVPNQKQVFHLPLHPLDSETQTHGCRHTNPSVCAKNSVPGVCAFVRKDDICLSPPTSWKNQFQKLFFKQFRKRIHKRPA